MTDTIEDIDLYGLVGNSDLPHIKCCEAEAFLCKAKYHPEAVAETDEEKCVLCLETFDRFLHKAGRPHLHCPFNPIKVCWRLKP